MVDSDACLQASDRGMVLTEPFFSHFKGPRDRSLILEERF